MAFVSSWASCNPSQDICQLSEGYPLPIGCDSLLQRFEYILNVTEIKILVNSLARYDGLIETGYKL